MNVLIFGDQTADQTPLLRSIVSRKDNSSLSTFLERGSLALKEEVQRLHLNQRSLIPNFLTVGHLLESYLQLGSKVSALESALLTLTQLAHFIGYFSEQPYPDALQTRCIGLCTGSLAATAVSCSRSISELIPIAVEAVRISFRTGLAVGSAASSLETEQHEGKSWSTIVTTNEQTARAELEIFHKLNSIPLAKRAYISAVSEMAVTISGPPSTTGRIFQSAETLQGVTRVTLPVYGPYHAAHLYQSLEKSAILDAEIEKNLRMFQPVFNIHSAASGKTLDPVTLFDLFQTAVTEILERPLKWNSLLEEILSQALKTAGLPCTLFTFGVTNVANSVVSVLKTGSQSSVYLKDHRDWAPPASTFGRTQNDKIAIIGMAGRFPSSSSHEMLWELLEKGLDVHREIPRDRFDANVHTIRQAVEKNKSHTPYGCFIDDPGLFDPRFFNMSPREAAQTDPMDAWPWSPRMKHWRCQDMCRTGRHPRNWIGLGLFTGKHQTTGEKSTPPRTSTPISLLAE